MALFNQCKKCYNETRVRYDTLCPSCYIEKMGGEGSGNFGHGGGVGGPGNPGGSTSDGGSEKNTNTRGHLSTIDEDTKTGPSHTWVRNQIIKDTGVDKRKANEMHAYLQQFTSDGYRKIRIAQGGVTDIDTDLPEVAMNEPTKQEYFNRGEVIEEYIRRAPKYTGRIYRAISGPNADRLANIIQVGDVIDMKGTSSWTSNESRMHLGFSKINFVTDNAKNATSLEHITLFPGEKEVIVSKDSKFKITNIVDSEVKDAYTGKIRIKKTVTVEEV